jgi:hypothetical protein
VPLDPLHDRIVRLAAQLPETRTVALAGGGAMLAHDLVDRLTQEVDLFTDRDAEEAVAVAAALRGALSAQGWDVRPAPRPPHENRFVAIDRDTGRRVQVEVFSDGGRLKPPVHLGVGPVLHRDDLAADKVLAMWGRGEPRDFLDVYEDRQLFHLAASKDRGLTPPLLAEALRGVRRLRSIDWEDAGIEPEQARHVTERISGWREQLIEIGADRHS